MIKPAFCICAVNTQLVSVFVFDTWIVKSLYFLNRKFQAFNHPLWLYSPVCVGPGRKLRRQVFRDMATVCFRLSGGHIAGIAVGSVALVAIAVTVGVCVYKKKCGTTGKTGPSHLTGKVSRNKIMVAGYV